MSNQLTCSDIQAQIEKSKFHQLFTPEITSIDYETLTLSAKLKMSKTLERQPGTNQWHGGAISAAIDSVGCYALLMVADELGPTVNFRTDYLYPGHDTDLVVNAHIRKSGRSIALIDVDVFNKNERLIAVGRACYSMLENKNFTAKKGNET